MVEPIVLKTRAVQTQESTIARLKDALKAAENGELIGVGVAGVCKDGSCWTSWSQIDDFARLLGSVTRLQYRMNAEQDFHSVEIEDDDGEGN